MVSAEFRTQLAVMRQNYLAQLPEKINHIHQIWVNYLESRLDKNLLLQLRTAVHNLAGSGATFGCGPVSDVAERLEMLLSILLTQTTLLSVVQQGQIKSYLVALDFALKQVSAPGFCALTDVGDTQHTELKSGKSGKLLFLVEDDIAFAQQFAVRMAQYDYIVRRFVDKQELEQALVAQRPVAMVVDMSLPQGEFAGAEMIRKLENDHQKPIPVVFVSIRKDFESRLQAVRAGATHYFVKPLDIESMVYVLDEIVAGGLPKKPYRVQIVDDDEALTNIYRLSLEEAGMQVVVSNDPLLALPQIKEFQPELILMDITMPGCDGLELATIVRQFVEYNLIPIVFLTTEWRIEKKLAAMNLGSDDFLTKPIIPWQLVESVKARVKRARVLRTGSAESYNAQREMKYLKDALDLHAIISMADVNGRIVEVNDKYCEVSGYSRKELLGQQLGGAEAGFDLQENYDDMWRIVVNGGIWQGETRHRKKNHAFYWLATTVLPFLDDFSVPQYYMLISSEITQAKTTQALLQASEEQLRYDQIFTNMGAWDWDVQTGTVLWSERIATLYGYTAEQLGTSYANVMHAVHPDDRQLANDSINACVEQGRAFDIEYRIVRVDGVVRWLQVHGELVRAPGGAPHMVGMVRDVTDIKKI